MLDEKRVLGSMKDEKIIELYPRLRQYCQFLSQNSWDGDDLAQEVVAKVLERYPNQSDVCPALLKKIAYNQWVDKLRKQKSEMLDSGEKREIAEKKQNAETLIEVIDSLLSVLTPKQAVIFLLKEGFRYRMMEIAEILETSEVSVKATLHRIRTRLMKDEEDQFVDLYWNEEDREQLNSLFLIALETEDPSILIKAIPTIRSLTSISTTPMLVLGKQRSRLHYSPSSTLSMAA